MHDELRNRFDEVFTALVQRQGRLLRGAVENKREEVWNAFNALARPYVADAAKWRAYCRELEQNKRIDTLAGGKF